MCGIAGYYFFTPNENVDQDRLINALIFGIDHRGGHACGFSAFDDDGLVMIEKAACEAKDFIKGRRDLPSPARFAITHTRFATQGHQGFMKNNHPVVNGGVHVTHNGHIMNDFQTFQKVGWEKRLAEVDTEAIPAIVAQEGWENWQAALATLEGGMAVAMAHEDYPGQLILAKGEMSPLFYYATSRMIVWASTKGCLMAAWKACIGKPPMADKIKELGVGDALFVTPDGIQEMKWEVKRSYTSGYVYRSWDDQAWGNDLDGWDGAEWYKDDQGNWKKSGWIKGQDGVWRSQASHDEKYKSKETKSGNAEGGLDAAALALVPGAEDVRAEIDQLRTLVDATTAREDEWWRDEDELAQFSARWDRIRELRGWLEEAAWQAVNDLLDEEEGETDPDETTIVKCPGCWAHWPLADMDEIEGMDDLYCPDCKDVWEMWPDEDSDKE